MPDSPAGSAAFLGGEEIVNDARTLAYLEAGYGPPGLFVSGGCGCPRLRELIECDSEPYSSPASDPAPWYDASVPESADFAGFLTEEFVGLGSTYLRENIDKITGGAVLGRLRARARPLTWRGYLFGRTDCAVRYGLSWLTAQLRGPNCSCNGEELDLLICCPDLDDSPPVSGCMSLPAVGRPSICPPYTNPNAFRTLKNVGLVEGPIIQSERKVGCTTNCGSSSCTGVQSLITEVEFSLSAGNPYLYGCPVCLCVGMPFPEGTTEDCDFVKILPGEECVQNECDPPFDCTALDTYCPPPDLPDIPVYQDGCFCDPLLPVTFCCDIPTDTFGEFFEGAPVIEIYSGSKAMRATTVRFYSNPLQQPCCDAAADPCLECDSIQIRFIPPDSIMTIDGTTRTVTVLCPGMGGVPMLADHLTVTPFAWPILQCNPYCICVETEGSQVAENATVTISIVPREM